jgi:2-C-methyl-D-erythritol 2,4-cyclodiphosphate synthase
MRVGLGFDIHRLVEGRPLFLGGLELDWPRGLLGHSDGDCLLHALVDALLGAAGLGDIGDFFPDSEERWQGVRSTLLLENVLAHLRGKGFRPQQVDATVFAGEPKLGPKKQALAQNLAGMLGLPADAVTVKAKTMDGLGAVGAGEAIAAQVLVLVEETPGAAPAR